jgi:3',5'-cyclic AMP phosphodiesterase CpdA
MPLIAVTSDLHLGLTAPAKLQALRDQIAEQAPDLTVLAGDLGEPLRQFVACLRLFADLPGEMAVLAGNHDVWATGSKKSQDLWERDLPAAVRDAGMIWLEEQSLQAGDVAVAGSLAWYDYSAADPALASAYTPSFYAAVKPKINNDGNYVDWPWTDVEFANRLGDGLMQRLDDLESRPDVMGILAVTHAPLCEEQLVRKPDDLHWSIGNAYLGNLTLGRRVLAASKVRAIVSGHTHVGCSGHIERSDGSAMLYAVVPSEYGDPACLLVDAPAGSADWSIRTL